jgi:hypothetical protein
MSPDRLCRYTPVKQPRNTTRTGVHGPAQHAGDQVVPVGLRAAHVPTRLLLFSRSRYRRIDPHARRTGPGALENDRFARRLGRQPPRLSTLMARSQNCPRLPTEINRITDFADGVATMSAVRVARETDSPVLRTWRRWSWLPCPAGSCVLHQGRARCFDVRSSVDIAEHLAAVVEAIERLEADLARLPDVLECYALLGDPDCGSPPSR